MGQYWECFLCNNHNVYENEECWSCGLGRNEDGAYSAEQDDFEEKAHAAAHCEDDGPPKKKKHKAKPGCPEDCPFDHDFTLRIEAKEEQGTPCPLTRPQGLSAVLEPEWPGAERKWRIAAGEGLFVKESGEEHEELGTETTGKEVLVSLTKPFGEVVREGDKVRLTGGSVEVEVSFAFGSEPPFIGRKTVSGHDVTFHVKPAPW